MLAQVGSILTGFAFAAAVYATVAVVWSIRSDDRRWWESGRNAIFAATGLLGAALVILLLAFISDGFIIEYVAHHSSRDLPLYLKVSAIWGGQEGSLLLWAFLQTLFAALLARQTSQKNRALVPWATVFLSSIAAFFVAVTLFRSNPFRLLAVAPADGRGLNPLLRHPGMVFHPPPMYLGYVGLAVPFALALSSLITGRVDAWPGAARGWTLAAWIFLSLGLLLGMRWAYDVLGWGGYWGWDPVENAGLMPWLTATAMIHGLVMQDRGRGFRGWNVMLAVMSFALVLFGTFITRSGLIQSVHAFARSDLGPYFLAAIGMTVFGSLGVFYWRRRLLSGASEPDGLLSREGAFTLTMILLLTLTGSVFIGSVLPTVTEALVGQRFEADPSWFDRVTGPQFAALVLLMGVCPLLGRTAGALRRLGEEGRATVAGGLLVPVVGALAGFTRASSLIGFSVVGLAGGTALAEIVRGVMRGKKRGGSVPAAVWKLVGRHRRRYGGYLVHIGVVLLAIGVIGTRLHPYETEAVLRAGESVDVQGYTLTLGELERTVLSDRVTTYAPVSVRGQGRRVSSLRPGLAEYATQSQTVGTPAVRVGIREDLYIVLAGWSDGGEHVALKIFVNPLVSFLWLGALILTTGGAVAVWPRPGTKRRPASVARRRLLWSKAGLAVGVSLLGLAAWALWGTARGPIDPVKGPREGGMALAGGAGRRPMVGEPAPNLSADLLDGSSLRLTELRGQIVVINFWSPQCQPCRAEIPHLQAVWEEYGSAGVAFVGISFPELEAEVREMVSELGVTYPNGISAAAAVSYGITAVPETFVVGPEGRVVSVHIGPVTADQMRRVLDALVAE